MKIVTRLNRIGDLGHVDIDEVRKKKIVTRLNRIEDVGPVDIDKVCKKKILTRFNRIEGFGGTRSGGCAGTISFVDKEQGKGGNGREKCYYNKTSAPALWLLAERSYGLINPNPPLVRFI